MKGDGRAIPQGRNSPGIAIPHALGISGIAYSGISYSASRNKRNSPENLGCHYSETAIPKFKTAIARNSAENLAIPLFPLRGDVLLGTAPLPRGLAALQGGGP